MKRAVLSGLMLLAGAALVSAFGLSVFAGTGYAFGVDAETYGTDIEREPYWGDCVSYINQFYQHARGPRALAGLEITLGDFFSIEVSGGYFAGRPAYIAFYHSDFAERRTTEATTSFVPAFLTLKSHVPAGKPYIPYM